MKKTASKKTFNRANSKTSILTPWQHSALDKAIVIRTLEFNEKPKKKAAGKQSQLQKLEDYSKAVVHVLPEGAKEGFAKLIQQYVPNWQVGKTPKDVYQVQKSEGLVFLACRRERPQRVSHAGMLEESNYTWYREQLGQIFSQTKAQNLEVLEIYFHGLDSECLIGALIGLELAAYQFKNPTELPQLVLIGASEDIIQKAKDQGRAINLARHLVNLPPNHLVPGSFVDCVKEVFKSSKNTQVTVWDEKQIQKENLNLLMAVGQGSVNPPRLVRISYRPKGSTRKPIAFVGKGITFDSGGLDIKPSSGMRLMKKDMGGAAAVLGLAHWVSESHYPYPVDFYMALAENSVDGKSMRPSDIYTSRNGHKVEIHNTDAEGRLVLCDALDVAVTQKGKDEPEIVIDLATLTGAIKVALGSEIAGLFSNDDALADALNKAGYEAGDLNWRMPLYGKYFSSMNSSFADFQNASDGFGGAITAALYLEKFVRGKVWAHLDIYAWNDRASGSLSSTGGSGQPVQALIRYLETRV